MSCCSPEYRKVVKEKEERVNQKGQDSLPFWLKTIMILIPAGGLIFTFLMK